jgi:hypothetical protein
LDYPAKAEGGDYKTDRSRYENIAEASAKEAISRSTSKKNMRCTTRRRL